MEKPQRSQPELHLPNDLEEFLSAGKQLEYEEEKCEARGIRLVGLDDLKLERFPVETGSLEEYEQDPHYPNRNSYLVLGVNLVADTTGGYDAVGLLLWLPIEQRYAIWDSSHCDMMVFDPEVTWTKIAADPIPHINAGWTGIDPTSPTTQLLVPWPNHPYHHKQVYDPQPY